MPRTTVAAIADCGRRGYTRHVKGRRFSVILVNTVLVFCVLFLVVALSAMGTGILAILSIVISLGAVIFVSLPPLTAALLPLRAAHRRFSSRAPPRF